MTAMNARRGISAEQIGGTGSLIGMGASLPEYGGRRDQLGHRWGFPSTRSPGRLAAGATAGSSGRGPWRS